MPTFEWNTPALRLTFSIGEAAPVSLRSIGRVGDPVAQADPSVDQPLVEVSALGHGRFPGSFRHVDTVLGAALRYVGHSESTDAAAGATADAAPADGAITDAVRADGAVTDAVRADAVHELRIEQREPETGLRVVSVFRVVGAIAAFRTWTVVDVVGGNALTLDFISTFATGSWLPDSGVTVDEFELVSGENDWVAESRWTTRPLREVGLARIDRDVQTQPPRSRCLVTNRGSWSTGERLPTGVIRSEKSGYSLAWQIEHNGPWSYELGETRHGAYLLLNGPCDQEHQWTTTVSHARSFTTVPASVGIARGGTDDAFAVLTDQRRALRTVRPADRALPVIFNDYMNTLMGDPTTEKLLPLIDAAAEVGAEYFCIDAGWYAGPEGNWWDSVGAWRPAAHRFPGGISEVIDHIRDRGMVAGLWLEPEVIGVRSPLAISLPDDAFFSRNGIRVSEHGRHLLDLRSAAARDHLNEVVDRLVSDYGVGFFKMDYNTMTGPGTDRAAAAAGGALSAGGTVSPGDGLLEHNRALLDWLDEVQLRHPSLLIENCASGAMRMDYAMMGRLHLQSTSDQQDPVMYAPIAAAAPASLLPEQAGNWAYPQAGMEPELLAFALTNAILGRMYLSGYLNRMSEGEIALVSEAVAAQKTVLAGIEESHAVWPLGLPGWEDGWIALGLMMPAGADAGADAGANAGAADAGSDAGEADAGGADAGADAASAGTMPGELLYLSVWRRPGAPERVVLPLPSLRGREVHTEVFFPREVPGAGAGWATGWDAGTCELTVTVSVEAPTARVFRLRVR